MNASNLINRLVAKKLTQGGKRDFCQFGKTFCGYRKAVCINWAACVWAKK